VLINRFVPRFDAVERHRATVAVPPDRVWAALRDLDLGRSRTVRWLLAVRGLRKPGRRPSFTVADAERFGFVVLVEEPPVEVVLGVIGRFWRPRGGVVRVTPEEFTAFERPGYAKAAWCFRLGAVDAGTEVLTETRVVTTEATALRRFRRYWRLIRPFSGWVRRRSLALLKEAAEAPERA